MIFDIIFREYEYFNNAVLATAAQTFITKCHCLLVSVHMAGVFIA